MTSTKSDTPRTDALLMHIFDVGKETADGPTVAEHARELEREINQLKMERDEYKELMEKAISSLCGAIHPQPEQGK